MEYAQILTSLHTAAEPNYAAFQKRIVSDTAYPILGVRMPALRTLAKQASAGDWRSILSAARCDSYEEVMLIGLMIAYAPVGLGERLAVLRNFLPKLDSWALTDSIAPTLASHPDEQALLWDFARECLAQSGEYSVRFGIVLMLRFFLTEEKIPQVADCLTAVRDERYYVNMALAWCLAEMAVHNYKIVEEILKNGGLNRFVHHKTIQKMRESYRFTKEQKAAVALLRRKENETNYGN